MDLDFIGFTYNGKHSYRDLKIYRTSNGDRYEMNLTPTMTEKTASVDGQIGQYFFGTKIETLSIPLSFAFDDLSEAGLLELKKVFNGDGIHDLIFDETPYKVYSAKVTGTAVVKHLCFEINGVRHYRGEGSVQFTCYYPYALSRIETIAPSSAANLIVGSYTGNATDGFFMTQTVNKIPCGLFVYTGQIISIDFGNSANVVESYSMNCIDSNGTTHTSIPTNGKNYFITDISIVLRSQPSPTTTAPGTDGKVIIQPRITIQNDSSGDSFCYDYTNKGCFEQTSGKNGKILNHYSLHDFPTKVQWGFASGLPFHSVYNDNVNCGDRPIPFELTYVLDEEKTIPENTELQFGEAKIKVLEPIPTGFNLIWNSKLGILVKEKAGVEGVLVPFQGNACVLLESNNTTQPAAANGVLPTCYLRYEYY